MPCTRCLSPHSIHGSSPAACSRPGSAEPPSYHPGGLERFKIWHRMSATSIRYVSNSHVWADHCKDQGNTNVDAQRQPLVPVNLQPPHRATRATRFGVAWHVAVAAACGLSVCGAKPAADVSITCPVPVVFQRVLVALSLHPHVTQAMYGTCLLHK